MIEYFVWLAISFGGALAILIGYNVRRFINWLKGRMPIDE